MSEKQTIGGITPKTPKSIPAEASVNIEEAVVRTMQKDIDSLRDRASAKSPQNLPIAEKDAKPAKGGFASGEEAEKKTEPQRELAEKVRKEKVEKEIEKAPRKKKKDNLIKRIIAKFRKSEETLQREEEQKKAKEQKIIEEQETGEEQRRTEEQIRAKEREAQEKKEKIEKALELQSKLAEKIRKEKEREKEKETKKTEEQKVIEERKRTRERRKAEERENELAEKIRRKEEKIQKKENERARKKAIQEQKRKLKALKIIAFKTWLKTSSLALIKFSMIIAAVILILGGAGGFLYWWNYIRVAAPPVVVTHYQCQDFQCVSVEGEGVDQCQTEQDCQPAEPEIPQSLIPVDKTELIEMETGHSELFIQSLKLILEKDKEEGALARILIKTISRTERKYADLNHFLSLLGFSLPEKIVQSAVEDELGGANYTFFLYNQAEGKRLGFVIKITEEVDLISEFREWEANVLEDINALFVNLDAQTLSAAAEGFQDNIYNGIAIRYLNFPNPDLSIDYAIVGDKLIVATSKESMYVVIDALLSLKAGTMDDSGTGNPAE